MAVPIEHLDYEFIEKSRDEKHLYRILKVLESGKEGYFPHLVKTCKDRIRSINPDSRYIRESTPLISLKEYETTSKNELSESLSSWLSDIGVKDDEIRTMKDNNKKIFDVSCNENCRVPIRSAPESVISPKISSENPPESQNEQKPMKTKRLAPRSYNEWDKLNVNELLADVDDNSNSEKIESKTVSNTVTSHDSFSHQVLPAKIENLEALSFYQREQLSEKEKIKGNEAFNSKDYSESIVYFSRCIEYSSSNIVSWNNRALAHLKLSNWDAAIIDCTQVLSMDSLNVKALMRRAIAYKEKKLYYNAKDDLKLVLSQKPYSRAEKMLKDISNEIERSQIVEISNGTEPHFCSPADKPIRQSEDISTSNGGGHKMIIHEVEDDDENDDDDGLIDDDES